MSLAYASDFYEEFYEPGSGLVSDAGTVWPAALGDFGYLLDSKREHEWSHGSVPLLRGQADIATNVGSQTLNPEAFWRRTFESWHVGAGQTAFDRPDASNPWRFRRSKGINVWTRYQAGLLYATDAKALWSTGTGFLAVAGDFLYATNGTGAGTALLRTADITVGTPTFTTITGTPAVTASSIASDGFNILTAHGASGIYKTTRGAATTASNITGTVTHVAYGKGRWIATQDNNLYDVTTLVAGGGALPAALFSHSNTDFDWNCFAEGPTAFYAGGFSGDKSLIYRLTMKEDGTGLNQPVVAGFLPDGELISAMQGYLGFVLIGTSKGVRVGIVGGNGDLTIGALIPTDAAVKCFEGQDKFVWFGWSNFEGADGGLGRLDLETFSNTEALAPAYASDLMAGQNGTVVSCVTFQNRRVFTLDTGAAAVPYGEEVGTYVTTGQIDSGLFDYGLTDPKLSLYADVSFVADGGTVSVSLARDRGAFASLATITGSGQVGTGEARANEFEIRMTLNQASASVAPVLRSWSLRAQAAAPITEEIIVPFLIAPEVHLPNRELRAVDTRAQIRNIKTLCANKTVTIYREGLDARSVIVADYKLDVKELYANADEDQGVNGVCMVRMKEVTSS